MVGDRRPDSHGLRMFVPKGSRAMAAALGGGWTEEDPNRPCLIEMSVTVETDGITAGTIEIGVDYDGGSTADYTATVEANAAHNAGAAATAPITVYLPPGATIDITNLNDPNVNNAITDSHKAVM